MRNPMLLAFGSAIFGLSSLLVPGIYGDELAVRLKADLKSTTNSLGMELVLITPEKSAKVIPHSIDDRESWEERSAAAATRPFYIGKTEVTQAQWVAVMASSPWANEREARLGQNLAATCMAWDDIQVFCKKLTEREKRGRFRLPTEAEWEYACSAGTRTRYSFGDDETALDHYAWNADNAEKKGEEYAHAVARKRPNPFGLFDMHGNAFEAVEGLYAQEQESLYPSKKGSLHVGMGGSWRSRRIAVEAGQVVASTPDCGSRQRAWFGATYRSGELGFRVAWTPDEE